MAIIQQEKPNSPEEEIRELERRLEEKKQELATQGNELKPEKEVLREVLREKIQSITQPPPSVLITPPPSAPDTPQKTDQHLTHEEREADIQALIEIAMTRTITDAISHAQSESPYLLDELHDHLVDDYYEKLIALRKIKPL